MRAIFLSIAAMGLMVTPLTACNYLSDPAHVEGALPAEANNLRVIKAALTVTGAYTVLGQQVDKGLVTVSEAARVKKVIDQAHEAVKLAATAVEINDMSAEAKLVALQNLLDALAREAILKGS